MGNSEHDGAVSLSRFGRLAVGVSIVETEMRQLKYLEEWLSRDLLSCLGETDRTGDSQTISMYGIAQGGAGQDQGGQTPWFQDQAVSQGMREQKNGIPNSHTRDIEEIKKDRDLMAPAEC